MLLSIAFASLLAQSPAPAPGITTQQTAFSPVPTASLNWSGPPKASTKKASRDGALEGLPIKLETEDKLELEGRYFSPKRSKKLVPGIMVVHDQGGSIEPLTELSAYLASKGFGVLLVDLRGHGKNAGEKFDWKKADKKGKKTMWAYSAKDLRAAANFLSGRKELHKSKLIVIGHGKGCALAVNHAIEDRNTLATVLIQPADKVYDFELKKELPELDGVPTLLVGGKGTKKPLAKVVEASSESDPEESSFEVSLLRSEPAKVLDDTRLAKTLFAWLGKQR